MKNGAVNSLEPKKTLSHSLRSFLATHPLFWRYVLVCELELTGHPLQ